MSTARDRPKLAYTCSYVPEEIILAAGFEPVRFVPQAKVAQAEGYIHPNTCRYLKSLLAAGLESNPSLAGIILSDCCDGMRRLADLWDQYVPDTPALFLDLPKKRDPESVSFFASELRRLLDQIHTRLHPAWEVDQTRLAQAIVLGNRLRTRMASLFPMLGGEGVPSCAKEVHLLCLERPNLSVVEFSERVDRLLMQAGDKREGHMLAHAGSPSPGLSAKRVILSGSLFRGAAWIDVIEDLGGKVVDLDSCLGSRNFRGEVEENTPDPLAALAERYLSRPPCPRMYSFADRFDYLLSRVRTQRAGGVIYAPLKFCDPFAYDSLLLQQRCQGAGIPMLVVENDYEAAVSAQTRTRIGAFLEML